ncbi:MAG: transporter [Verrucomicrobiia bacterium]
MIGITNDARAGRPLTVDDAEPVGVQQLEWEAGFGYVGGHWLRHMDFPFGLTYGVWPRVEAGFGFGGQIEEREETLGEEKVISDIGDLTLGTKVKVLTADRWWADQSLAFAVKFPTASYNEGFGSGRMDYDLTWILSKPITDKWNIHFNAGHTWTGDHQDEMHDDVLHYGLALDYQITERVQLVAEIFADTPITAEQDTSVRFNGGVRWSIMNNLVLDAALGTGVRCDPAEITATIGLTWTFDFGRK